MVIRRGFLVNEKEFTMQGLSERVKRNIVFGDVGLGKRFMEGSQVGARGDIRAIKRIMLVDNRNLVRFDHGNKETMNVEDKVKRVSQEKCKSKELETRVDATNWPWFIDIYIVM